MNHTLNQLDKNQKTKFLQKTRKFYLKIQKQISPSISVNASVASQKGNGTGRYSKELKNQNGEYLVNLGSVH